MQVLQLSTLAYGFLALATSLDIIDSIRRAHNLPALTAGITNPNRTIQVQAAGYRKYGVPINATPYDQYHLGSNTKAMTAVLIAKYIEDGKFTWNTTLTQILPEWRTRMQASYQDVTIAQLASHRSGFTDMAAAQWLQSSGIDAQAAAAAQYNASAVEGRRLFIEQAFNVTPTSPPDLFSYSNQNYIILGFIKDTLFGPWEEQLEEWVWRPLNMTECGYGNFPEPNATAVEGMWPHAQGNPDPIPLPPTWENENPRLLGPAGTVRCSPSSYSRFLAMHLDGAIGRDTAVLQASSFAKLHTPYRVNSGQNYTPGGWMAFESDNPKLGKYLAHDGSNTYNYASAIVLHELDTAMFSLTNIAGPDPGQSDAQKGVSKIMQQLLNGSLAAMPVIENGTVNSTETGLPSAGVSDSADASPRNGVAGFSIVTLLVSILLAL